MLARTRTRTHTHSCDAVDGMRTMMPCMLWGPHFTAGGLQAQAAGGRVKSPKGVPWLCRAGLESLVHVVGTGQGRLP